MNILKGVVERIVLCTKAWLNKICSIKNVHPFLHQSLGPDLMLDHRLLVPSFQGDKQQSRQHVIHPNQIQTQHHNASLPTCPLLYHIPPSPLLIPQPPHVQTHHALTNP
jgi:hypothetical protein